MTRPPIPADQPTHVRWLPTGAEAFQRMIPAIEAARTTIRFEMYIYRADPTGELFRVAFTAAARRGVRVQLLLDGLGARGLPEDYWAALREARGEVRIFNPLSLRGFLFRDHRKLLLIDDDVAFIGGFNVADEYNGDGITQGWCDLGWELRVPEALKQLAAGFDSIFATYDLKHQLLHRMRQPLRGKPPHSSRGPVLLGGPRVGKKPFGTSLHRALVHARNVQLISGYFVPNRRLRQALRRVARRGGNVEILLAGKSDVPIAQRAARSLYGSLLRAGVKIYEYQPQILHAKMAVVDDAVFVGSANLDIRSFGINYELMVRLDHTRLATEAREIFALRREQSVAITLPSWRKSRTWITRLRGYVAFVFFTQIDPWIVRRALRGIA
jgi:cardiolipin synthase